MDSTLHTHWIHSGDTEHRKRGNTETLQQRPGRLHPGLGDEVGRGGRQAGVLLLPGLVGLGGVAADAQTPGHTCSIHCYTL